MKLKIALLAGDGIGPEVIDQAVKVSDAIAKKFDHQIVSRKIFWIRFIIFDKILNLTREMIYK